MKKIIQSTVSLSSVGIKAILLTSLATSVSFLFAVPKQVTIKTLHKRGEVGNQLYYLPDQDTPFSGKAVSYWADGVKKTEISYKDGKRDGPKSHWYENGQKLSEINYKNGKHDGLLTNWYENGQCKRTGNYKEGKMDGIWTYWYENEQKSCELNYMEGYMGSAIVWKGDGEKCSVSNVMNGNGVMVRYTSEGKEWLRLTYKDGEMRGHNWVQTKRDMMVSP